MCSQSRLVEGALVEIQNINDALTSGYIEHIPVVFFWRNRRAFLTGDERLEQPDGRTVDIASDESHSNTVISGQALQIGDEIIPFFLHGSSSAI